MNLTAIGSTDRIQSAIADASRKTGIDFSYLIGQANVESGMRADAKASTSSATGLYQFIDQSWLGVIKAHGAEHGLGWAADAIQQTSSGRYSVSDANLRQTILDLRKDPTVASLMAAEHASDNKDALESTLGRDATGTDLYMAHFLGLGGARSFLSAMQTSPQRSGASMFPAAARANRNIFYDGNGQPRSLQDIYTRFAAKLDKGAAGASGALDGATGAPNPYGDLPAGLQVLVGTGAKGNDKAWVQTTLANLGVLRGNVQGLGDGASATATADAATTSPLMAALSASGAIPGQGGAAGDPSTLTQFMSPRALAALYRPTPETARLAYLMLAKIGA